VLTIDQATAAHQLEQQLRTAVQALEASQWKLTAREHAFIVRATANASAALADGDMPRMERGLAELAEAAEILSRAW
jgi:hypothetical protein